VGQVLIRGSDVPRGVGRPGTGTPGVELNRGEDPNAVTRARGQAGFSLTESLAGILLVTLVIFGLAAGILTAVRATRVVSETQAAEAALTDATESVKAQPYSVCADITTYAPAVGSVTAIEYLQSGTSGRQFGDTCDPAADVAQRVTIEVDGRSADVVKRNPAVLEPAPGEHVPEEAP
jgi:Tfp pilus assembly protein PilV